MLGRLFEAQVHVYVYLRVAGIPLSSINCNDKTFNQYTHNKYLKYLNLIQLSIIIFLRSFKFVTSRKRETFHHIGSVISDYGSYFVIQIKLSKYFIQLIGDGSSSVGTYRKKPLGQ